MELAKEIPLYYLALDTALGKDHHYSSLPLRLVRSIARATNLLSLLESRFRACFVLSFASSSLTLTITYLSGHIISFCIISFPYYAY